MFLAAIQALTARKPVFLPIVLMMPGLGKGDTDAVLVGLGLDVGGLDGSLGLGDCCLEAEALVDDGDVVGD